MECVGTAILCFTVGTAVKMNPGLAGVSIGSVLMCIVYFGGHISGGQYNPAVALTIFLRGKMHAMELGFYALSQIAGGFIGGLLAMAVLGSSDIGYPNPGAGVGVGSALVGEIVMTFALCHVILHVATTSAQANNNYYGLAIGFTVVSGAIGVGPFSGGAFNPAVGIALPLLNGEGASLWIYIVGPCIGSALAALTFAFTHSNELPGTGPLRSIKAKFKDSETRKLAAPIIIECIGTGLLAFMIATSASPANGGTLAPIAIGSTLMCQIYAGGATSGGQFNPAVTLGIAARKILASWHVDTASAHLKREFTNVKTIAYVLAQCVGSLIGAFLGRLVTLGLDADIGCPVPVTPTFNLGSVFVGELVATFLLVFVVLQAATSSKTAENEFFGLAIGFVVVSMACAVGGVSGGALNPAIGLMAIVSKRDSFTHIWMYWVACPLGGILAALLFRVTNAPEFLSATDDAKTERVVEKAHLAFSDHKSTEVERQSNVLHHKASRMSQMTTTITPGAVEIVKEQPSATTTETGENKV